MQAKRSALQCCTIIPSSLTNHYLRVSLVWIFAFSQRPLGNSVKKKIMHSQKKETLYETNQQFTTTTKDPSAYYMDNRCVEFVYFQRGDFF